MMAQREREPDDPYGGRIVFSSSVTGLVVVPNLAAYAATKAALAHLASVLAVELGPHGITVNALGIGATVNERNLADDPRYAEHWAGVIPTGRVGTPQDVAAALRFLVSPEAEHVSGHTLRIDGGWSHLGRTPYDGRRAPGLSARRRRAARTAPRAARSRPRSARARSAASASSRCSTLVAPTIGAVTPGLCSSHASATCAVGTPRSPATSAARSTTSKSTSGV